MDPSPAVIGLRVDEYENADESVTDVYLGYTEVTYPARHTSGNGVPSVVKMKNVGFAVGADGLMLGYVDKTKIELPDEEGVLYFEVRNEEDLEILTKVIKSEKLKGHSVTIVINPNLKSDKNEE